MFAKFRKPETAKSEDEAERRPSAAPAAAAGAALITPTRPTVARSAEPTPENKERKRKERLQEVKLEIHKALLENLNLAAMARDRVWTSCAMALPSRDKGAAGAVVRPVAIGLPNQR